MTVTLFSTWHTSAYMLTTILHYNIGVLTQADVENKVNTVRRYSEKAAMGKDSELHDEDDEIDRTHAFENSSQGIAMKPFTKKNLFPSIHSIETSRKENVDGKMASSRRPTFMNSIEERDSDVTNPMSQSFCRDNVWEMKNQQNDGILTASMVIQRRPTFFLGLLRHLLRRENCHSHSRYRSCYHRSRGNVRMRRKRMAKSIIPLKTIVHIKIRGSLIS